MKTLRLFKPGGTQSKRVMIRRIDSAGIEVSRFRVSRQELNYMLATGKIA